MKKSSTSNSKALQKHQLSIDLKPFCNDQSSSDQEEIIYFDKKQKAKHNKKRSQSINDQIGNDSYNLEGAPKYAKKNNEYYSDNDDDNLDYNDYDVPTTKAAHSNLNHQNSHHQNRRHNSHRHHKQNSRSSKLYKSIYYESLNKKPNKSIINTGEMLAIAKSQIQENLEKRKNNNDNFQFLYHQKEIESNFDNDNNYYKIPYKNTEIRDINNIDDDNNYEEEANFNNFDEIYHFSTKQYIQNENDQSKSDDNKISYSEKRENNLINDNNYQKFVTKQKMVFHDTDQLDDSLNIFIEEEEYFENKQSRSKKSHHKDIHRKKHKRRLISADLNELNTDESSFRNLNSHNIANQIQRKPLNQEYQKYMSSKSQAENARNYGDNNYDMNDKMKNNCSPEYSILNFANGSQSATNEFNYAQKVANGITNPNVKFVQSEEILSKNNDSLDSLNDQESPQDDQYTISDVNFIEDINLKITVKDANENNAEKVQQFNIFSLKNDQPSGKDEFVEEEEECESETNQISNYQANRRNNEDLQFEMQPSKASNTTSNGRNQKSPIKSPTKSSNSKNSNSIRIDANQLIENDESKTKTNNDDDDGFDDNAENAGSHANNNIANRSPHSTKTSKANKNRSPSPTRSSKSNANSTASRTMNNAKVSNLNANSKGKKPSSQTVGNKNANGANNDDLLDEKEEESDSSVASFCDVSTSFDSQNQLNDKKNDDEKGNKDYKTAEINVTLRDIREAVGNSNKSVKKSSRKRRKQPTDATIVTTHRRKMKRSAYRKRLVHKSIQTEKVDNPSYTLAMLEGY